MNPLFVGIDVSGKNNVAYLMKPDGSKHSSFSVQNNRDVAKMLSERIVSALSAMQLGDVVIGTEVASIYGDNLVYALREDDSLGRIGKEVYMDDYRYKSLQTLTRARFDVIQNLTREKQRFANYLFLKCSGTAQDKDIANSSATTIALMKRFETTDELAYTDLNELTEFVRKTGRGRFADPEVTAKAIQAAAKGSYRLSKTVNDTVNQAISVSTASMRALKGQVKV